MMIKIRVLIPGFVVLALFCGCQTTRPTADHRTTQADHLTQRESESATKKARRPLDDRPQDRQGIVDQPR
ncbi:MAG: hypothetical protein O7D91_05455 [Planctomycetota bacterium]|nr:hypothetical protein [Planctomycetota bacterium]